MDVSATVVGGRMNEWFVVGGVGLAALSGLPGLFFKRASALGERIAVALLALATGLGGIGAVRALIAPSPEPGLALSWSVPGGVFRVYVDALSAMFLVQIFLLSFLGAVYGLGYWKQAEHPDNGRKLRLFYGVVTAAMALLVVARNALLFLAGWEVMALAAFLLITTEDQDKEVREVGYIYLVATRIGTLCLFAMFVALFGLRGNWNLEGPLDARSSLALAVFLLGFVGFGLKAGIMPFHVWLPGAHANAPSHVSAVMSGVLIKMGIYGLVRITSFFPSPPFWWGGLVLGFGIASGILGVAFAIGQHDIKRLLAYHSVENIGIICIGIGLALVGRALGRPELVVLGLAGGLLHVWNHGLFKALLFLAAGSVLHATGTREIDKLGGLLKSMPRTGLAFLVGAVSISGLPPLNGFISEFLIYIGLLRATNSGPGTLWMVSALAAAGLALIGALAVACFVKVFGVVFLGEARSEAAKRAHEPSWKMIAPMFVLATLCAFIGLGSLLVVPVLDRAAAAWAADLAGGLLPSAALAPLAPVSVLSVFLLVVLIAVGGWLRSRTRHAPAMIGTWGCGYAAPSSRMQYTSSSFAELLVGMFRWALRPQVHPPRPRGIFPEPSHFASHVPDTVLDGILLPGSRAAGRAFRWLRFLQAGSMHAYLLYILATLVGLLVWHGGR
jgi:hydrogenase-4 component B